MAPPLFGDEWEDEAKAVIYLRGALSVDMGSARTAPWTDAPAGRAGSAITWVRVFARNRREVNQALTTSCSSGASTR